MRHKVRLCKECGRKRWLYYQRDDSHDIWTCSKGHTWKEKLNRFQQIEMVLKDVFIDWLSDSINIGPTLSRTLRKR